MVISILIPEYAKLFVKPGQEIGFDMPFYEVTALSDIDIPLAKKLGVKPDKIFHHLKKFVGEEVKKGETLAVKKTLFSTHKVVSDYDGKIKEINHDIGSLILSVSGDEAHKVKTYFKGEVAEIKNRELHLKIKESKSFPLKKLSGAFGGEVYFLENTGSAVISNDITGKILMASSITAYLESKVDALGIKGYITLHRLPDTTVLPVAQLKEIDDEKTIRKLKFPYCITDTKSGTISFYQ